MPSVLILTRTFPPDHAAVGQLVRELANELASRGWRVGIATATPPDPAGEMARPEGIQIARVPAAISFTRANVAQRLASYVSLYPALLHAAWKLGPNWDVVVTTTDPPLQALLGPLIRLRTKGALVHWCQDIYPELAEELGVIARGGLLATILRALSTWALRQCEQVVALGRCMQRRLLARGVSAGSIALAENWADTANIRILPRSENGFRRDQGFSEEEFLVMYSGNFGLAHPFEAVMEAARRLRESQPQVRFLFVGEGPRLDWVRSEAGRLGLSNTRFLPMQPRERLSESLGAADLHLVTMFERLDGLVVPSKYYGILAAGRPCVFCGPLDSEVGLSVRETKCGVAVGERDASGLVEAITRFATDGEIWERGSAAAGRAAQQFSLPSSVDKLTAAWQLALAELKTKG